MNSKTAGTKQSPDDWKAELFSQSSNYVLDALQKGGGAASLRDVLSAFYRIHPEYAAKPVSQLKIVIDFLGTNGVDDGLNEYSPAEWTRIVSAIIRSPTKGQVIHGRYFCLAALLHQHELMVASLPEKAEEWTVIARRLVSMLAEEAEQGGTTATIEMLTPKGKRLWSVFFGGGEPRLYQTANISDLPSDVDLLSRGSLAKYLANRLRFIYRKEVYGAPPVGKKTPADQPVRTQKGGAFFVHIDGAWGSGKSTLFGFLKKELESPQSESNAGWIVVDFNAWQHQRLHPPWWFLMKAVHQQSMQVLWQSGRRWKWIQMRLGEFFWRMNTGTNYLAAAFVTLLFLVGALVAGVKSEAQWKGLPLVQLASFLGFLWSLTNLLRTGLVPGSAKAAQKFVQEHGSDPMEKLAAHFEQKCRDLGQPVAIMIDDLDRCEKDYGVELLEGLQTIFKQAPVVFAIACDRKWLVTMYESQFALFSAIIGRPAKPFGVVFLDKIFQLSVELPSISSVHKKQYWDYLLNLKQDSSASEMEKARATIGKELAGKDNAEKLQMATEKRSGMEDLIAREEILANLSIGEEERYLEHRLQKFLPLIEPNPRGMKRIINDISTIKAISFLYKQDVNEDQLILWTILKIQYPLLADFFLQHPEKISSVHAVDSPAAITERAELDRLLHETNTRNYFAFELDPGEVVTIDEAFLSSLNFK